LGIMLLAVVIPVYNERALLPRLIERIDATDRPAGPDGMPVTRHLLLVDDGSTDGTLDLLADLGRREDVTCLHADRNRGKGSALRRGFAAALEMGCDLAIVQDADLEYDPADHGKALAPLIDGRADAVIGTRFLGETHRVLYFWHSVVNRGITALSNMLSNLNLTDIECGTKAFDAQDPPAAASETDRRPVRDRARDGREAREAPAARRSRGGERAPRIFEVPISYAGRTYAEGKKIGWRDGVEAIRCILQHNLFS
jgi:glycosyltransferase involved in cell wall biosynthesis